MPYSNARQYQDQVLADLGDRGANAIFELVFPIESQVGTWVLGQAGATSEDLARFIQEVDLKTSFESLPTVGEGNTIIRQGQRGFVIEFVNARGSRPMPAPSVDGSNLVSVGEIAVRTVQDGVAPVFNGDISKLWHRFDGTPDLERRFLQTRVAAMEEFLGILQMQVDQRTGDVQRYFSQQYRQAAARMTRFQRELEIYVPAGAPLGLSPTATSVVDLVNKTPNGQAYGQFACDGRGGFR